MLAEAAKEGKKGYFSRVIDSLSVRTFKTTAISIENDPKLVVICHYNCRKALKPSPALKNKNKIIISWFCEKNENRFTEKFQIQIWIWNFYDFGQINNFLTQL